MLPAKQPPPPRAFFTSEPFLPVRPKREPALQQGAERVVVATGRSAQELRAQRKSHLGDDPKAAILGLAELFLSPHDEFLAEFDRLGPLRDIVWLQEEPANMGALSLSCRSSRG